MGWKLEVAKMIVYISFPIAVFHYFNQPNNFEEWVIKERKKHFPVESKARNEEIRKFIYDFNAKAEKERLDEMEMQEKNKQSKIRILQ